MPKPKEGDKEVHRCWCCKQTKECTYGPDPFREDVNNDPRPVWECSPCRKESADEI